jgi:hypothetical protein
LTQNHEDNFQRKKHKKDRNMPSNIIKNLFQFLRRHPLLTFFLQRSTSVHNREAITGLILKLTEIRGLCPAYRLAGPMERLGPGREGSDCVSRDVAEINGGGGAYRPGNQEELQQEAEIGVGGLPPQAVGGSAGQSLDRLIFLELFLMIRQDRLKEKIFPMVSGECWPLQASLRPISYAPLIPNAGV